MTIGKTFQKIRPINIVCIFGLLSLFGCDDKTADNDSAVVEVKQVEQTKSDSKNKNVEQSTKVAEKSEPVIPTIELETLPAAVNLDPCQLLTTAELTQIGLPTDQHVAQLGYSQQLPNHSPITPFVGCKWRSVDHGTPLAWVHIQQITGDFNPETDEQFGLGDISWKATSQGRDHLMIKAGDRLIMIASQIPYNEKSEMESNQWIGKKVLGRLQQVADSTSVKHANASLVGGPAIDICAASRPANPHQLLQGNVAWSFPNIEINHVPSQNKRPQEDGVSCIYSSSRRGSVYVTYLGSDGVKRWSQHFEKNGEKTTFEGLDAFKDRTKLYIPLDKGALMVEARGIKYFSDEEIERKLKDIVMSLLNELN